MPKLCERDQGHIQVLSDTKMGGILSDLIPEKYLIRVSDTRTPRYLYLIRYSDTKKKRDPDISGNIRMRSQ